VTEHAAAGRLPHQGPALLLRAATHVDEDRIVCASQVRPDCPFLDEGRVPAFVGIEMGAQAAALHDIVLAGEDAPDKHGYIVAVRHARMHTGWLPVTSALEVRAERDGSAAPLYNYSVSVWNGEELLVEAAISTYVP